MDCVEPLAENEKLFELIENTVSHILDLIEQNDYNFPSEDNKDLPYLVNFCHGCAGAIPMLTAASFVFPDHHNRCLRIAIELADKVWS